MDPVLVIIIAAIIGFFAGFVGALLGLGGGVIIVPFLIILLGTDFQVAKIVSLFSMIPKCSLATYEHWKLGNIDFRMGITIGIMGVFGAVIGSGVSELVDTTVLIIFFAIFLFVSSIRFFLKSNQDEKKVENKWAVPVLGLGAGFLAGLLGIGGGVLLVQGMVYIGVTMHTAVGTSLLAIIFNATSGTVANIFLGHVDVVLMVTVTVAGLPGIVLGSRYCDECEAPVLKKYFGAAMIFIGIYLILNALGILQFS
jgi:uncharacterized membrane protein YfcA